MTQERNDTPTSYQGEESEESQPPSRSDGGVVTFFKSLLKPKHDNASLRETIEEFIEDETAMRQGDLISEHEKALISNVLKVRDRTAADVMVPRADIVAISDETAQEDLFAMLAEKQYSRLPVYSGTLDNVIGSVHVKDILATLARGQRIVISELVRDVPIISPAMQLLDLLLQMRMTRKHMVLVVDEFGGIDGLITIGDVIEAIVGEIYDEHDPSDEAVINEKSDGTYVADARLDIEEFEALFGDMLLDDEREENDTLGGLVIYIAGRVPVRGEVITHSSGMSFEIMDADPRRINRVCIRQPAKEG